NMCSRLSACTSRITVCLGFVTLLHYLLYSYTQPRPLTLTLFPYTTLFRSCARLGPRGVAHRRVDRVAGAAPPRRRGGAAPATRRSEEHTSELQSPYDLVCRLLLEKKNQNNVYSYLSSTLQTLLYSHSVHLN